MLSDVVSSLPRGKMTPLELITREARACRTVVIYGYELNGSSEAREIEPIRFAGNLEAGFSTSGA